MTSFIFSKESFLGSNGHQEISIDSIKPEEVLVFLKGFNTGLEIFKDLKGEINCKYDGKLLEKRVKNIVVLFKEWVKDIKEWPYLKDIGREIVEMTYDYHAIKASCGEWYFSITDNGKQLIKYFTEENYLKRLQRHILSNILPTLSRINSIIEAFKTSNVNRAGNEIGELVKFSFIWDYDYEY